MAEDRTNSNQYSVRPGERVKAERPVAAVSTNPSSPKIVRCATADTADPSSIPLPGRSMPPVMLRRKGATTAYTIQMNTAVASTLVQIRLSVDGNGCGCGPAATWSKRASHIGGIVATTASVRLVAP